MSSKENKNQSEIINFRLPKEASSIIKVIGVGGGGGNAVNHMFRQGITGVDFIVCNTDAQVLEKSPVPNKIQLGSSLTEGRGAGMIPEIGQKAAEESKEEIQEILQTQTKMVFITAGMGGGTGTGAAPVIAEMCKTMDVLTVGIVTIPFSFEGKKRSQQAAEGIEELKKYVDTLLVISNDKIREIYNDLGFSNAFGKADDILTTAAKGIAEIITKPGYINVDFADVKTVMTNSGAAIMGSGKAEGENRAKKAVENAINSPLLDDNNIAGAQHVLLYITYGNNELLMDEMSEIADYVEAAAGGSTNIIMGVAEDNELEEAINVTIIATGFKSINETGQSVTKNSTSNNISNEVVGKINDEELSPTKTHEFELNEVEASENANPIEEEPEYVGDDNTQHEDGFGMKDSELPENKDHDETETDNGDEGNVEHISLFDDVKDKKVYSVDDNNTTLLNQENDSADNIEDNEKPEKDNGMLFKYNERIQRLKQMTHKLKSPLGLKELEKQPAYKRRNVDLDDAGKAHEKMGSNMSVSNDEKGNFKLRQNNSFLHDNVD